ncbi:MAG TPA: serine/threonine-protein kinase [Gemmata sp.]
MPSDSIAGFLDTAKATRVLFPDQVEQLIRQPDIPQSDLQALCSYLQDRGVITKFQADAIREGRGHELTFGAYPVLDVVGPCPGGTAYRALHPSLRTPLVLRRLSPDAFAPMDSPFEVVNRARAFGTIAHPNLLPLLDAGVYLGHPYVVMQEPADAAPLDVLLTEVGGAMPGFLAAEYGCAIAAALRAVHERGGWHGEVRPGLIVVGPLTTKTNADGTTKRKPAPHATVKLAEMGLIPVRAPVATELPGADVLPYLPPERLDASLYNARCDIYGLGASLYLMLAGRPPHSAGSPEELVEKVRSSEPASLRTVRPDVPPELALVVMRMIAKRPDERPQTAAEVVTALAPFCRPGTVAAPPQPVVPVAAPASAVAVPYAVPVAVVVEAEALAEAEPEAEGWGVDPNTFTDAQEASTADTRQTRRRGMTSKDKSRAKIWLLVGLGLHLTAMGMLLAACFGGCLNFDSSPEPEPPVQKAPEKPKPNKQPRPKSS